MSELIYGLGGGGGWNAHRLKIDCCFDTAVIGKLGYVRRRRYSKNKPTGYSYMYILL
jgi:hypothetical protein